MRLLPFASIAAATLAAIALAACSVDSARSQGSAPNPEGGTVVPQEDASINPADAEPGPDVEAGARICSADGFCHSELPPNHDLRSVWGDGQGTVWAVSIQGAILRWDGAQWKVHMADVVKDEGMFAVWGTGPTNIYVATSAGLLHSSGATPAELTFAPLDLPGDPTIPIRAIWGTGPDDVWAAGGIELPDESPPRIEGRLLHWSGGDAGSWTLDDLSAEGIAFKNVWGSPTSGVWVQGSDGNEFGELSAHVRRRLPGATTWDVVDVPGNPAGGWRPEPGQFIGSNLSSDNAVWFSGFTGGFEAAVWRGTSTNGATFDFTFKKQFFGDRAIYAFWGLGVNDTWAVGDSGLIARWDGTKWLQATIRVSEVPVVRSFWAIWGTSNDDFWVVGDKIALHKTTQGKP